MRDPRYAIRNTLRRTGVEIVRSRQVNASLLGLHLDRLFAELGITTVIDVGAQHGVYGSWLRGNGYRGRIVSFEPVGASYRRLVAATARDERWEAHNLALGSADGDAEINVAHLNQLSSFRAPADVPDFSSALEVEHRETVPVRRVDSLWDGIVGREDRVYLKIDTQGWDLEVLAGATGCIRDVIAMQTEIAVQPLYVGSPTMEESLETISRLGFVPSGMFPVTLDAGLRLVEFDCVAVRDPRK